MVYYEGNEVGRSALSPCRKGAQRLIDHHAIVRGLSCGDSLRAIFYFPASTGVKEVPSH